MKRIVILLSALLMASHSFAAKAEDPFGLDMGEQKDQAGFDAWLKNPQNSPQHPLMWLRAVARSKQPQRANYFKLFFKQAWVGKKSSVYIEALADDLFSYDALVAEPYPTEGQKKEIAEARVRIAKGAEYFFRVFTRADRVRLYKVAEKFEGARLLIMDLNRLRQTEITDEWMVTLHGQEKQARRGYLFGMLEGRNEADTAAIIADYRDTIRFLLSFSKPPEELKGKALAKFKANQVKLRNAIMKKAEIFKY